MNNNKIPYGYIYKITNKLNGKIYIGLHILKNEPWRKYLGSSLLLKADIVEYGADNFIKSLEEYCYSKEQLAAREIIIMNDYKKKNYAMYNGNFGSPVFPFHDTYNHMDNVRKKEIINKRSIKVKENNKAKYDVIFAERWEEIIKLYQEHQHIVKVAKLIGVPKERLRLFLKENNIELNSQNTIGRNITADKRNAISKGMTQSGINKGTIQEINEADLNYLLNDLKMTTNEIAEKYNCSVWRINKYIRKFSLQRPIRQKLPKAQNKKVKNNENTSQVRSYPMNTITYEQLFNWYVIEKLSIQQICDKINYKKSTVYNLLKKHGITTNSKI